MANNPERQFDLGAWLFLAAVVGFGAAVLVSTLAILALPGDGWQAIFDTNPPELSAFFGDWPTLLQDGDLVLAINGVDLTVIYPQTSGAAGAWRDGATATYSILRGEQSLDVPVVLHTLGGPAILRAAAAPASDSVLEWSWGLIALFVFFRRPRSLAARLLLVAMLPHNLITKVGWAATTGSAIFAPRGLMLFHEFTDNFWSWLFWPTIIWLLLSFPRPVFPLTRWPRLIPVLLYFVPVAGVIGSLATGSNLPVGIVLVSELAALLAALVLAGVSAYRGRANPILRAQTAWVLLGFGLSLGLLLAVYLFDLVIPILDSLPGWALSPLTLALPICLGIAITRYRLFDIDVIIRRTLVYSVLTGLLALVYFGSVVVLEGLLRGVIGGDSPIAIVLSTLLIAALFGPLRARVQRVIDRAFYRRKYDAARTLATFAASARDETDLERLNGQLVDVVEETMQPEHVGLWIRQDR